MLSSPRPPHRLPNPDDILAAAVVAVVAAVVAVAAVVGDDDGTATAQHYFQIQPQSFPAAHATPPQMPQRTRAVAVALALHKYYIPPEHKVDKGGYQPVLPQPAAAHAVLGRCTFSLRFARWRIVNVNRDRGLRLRA